MRAILVALLSIMICSCASAPNADLWRSDEIFQNISVKYDSFRQYTSYTAPSITGDNILLNKIWFVRVFELHDSTLFTQLHVNVSYLDDRWKNMTNAKSKGQLFPTRSIRKNVTNCNETAVCKYQEDIIITVSLNKLKSLINDNGVVLFDLTDRLGERWSVELTARYIGALEAKLGL